MKSQKNTNSKQDGTDIVFDRPVMKSVCERLCKKEVIPVKIEVGLWIAADESKQLVKFKDNFGCHHGTRFIHWN